jgi:hypothetical protein
LDRALHNDEIRSGSGAVTIHPLMQQIQGVEIVVSGQFQNGHDSPDGVDHSDTSDAIVHPGSVEIAHLI